MDPLTRTWLTEVNRVERAVLATVLARWQTNRADFPHQATLAVLEGQRRTVAVTDAHLALYTGLSTGTSTAPLGVPPEPFIGVHARGGTPLEVVYARPAGRLIDEGATAALTQIRRSVASDIQMAKRNAAAAYTEADTRVVGYRRVLGSAKPCGLCIVASTQRYRKGDLAPIHHNCRCGVQPITQLPRDVGLNLWSGQTILDRARLEAFADEFDYSTMSKKMLGRQRVDASRLPSGVSAEHVPPTSVVHHGEMGPFLYVGTHRFTSLS